MKSVRLKELLAALTLEEKAVIVRVFYLWMVHQQMLGITDGTWPVPDDSPRSFTDRDPGFESRLAISVASGDRGGSLKVGVSEVFRLLPKLQREGSVPRFNAVFRRHLPARVFRLLYEAAGLDVDAIRVDEGFPVELMPFRG